MGITACLALGLCLAASHPHPPDAGTPKKRSAQAPDLSLPSFEALPTGADIQKPSSDNGASGPKLTSDGVSYQVVLVQHAHGFTRGPKGSAPNGGELKIIPMNKGKPPETDRFSTLVKVKCDKRVGAPIEFAVLDPRGDTVMQSSGQLVFASNDSEVAEYQVDWEPTALRLGGEHQLLIRIAHQPMGTWPLHIQEPR